MFEVLISVENFNVFAYSQDTFFIKVIHLCPPNNLDNQCLYLSISMFHNIN